jgi:hypothetical protein
MSLKPKKSLTHPELPSAKPDKWTGPWGRINPGSPSFDVVRFCQGATHANQKTHSYPYRAISTWHWAGSATEEELKIEAGADLVTVKGRGLDRIVEALDRGTLEILSEIFGEMPPKEENAIWVSSITVEGLPTTNQ